MKIFLLPLRMARPATLRYIRTRGKTLMVHRNRKEVDIHKGFYVAPGGKIEPEDEGSLHNTMLRETGLTPKGYELKGTLTFVNDERVFSDATTARTWGKRWQVALYVASDYEGELLGQGTEGDLEWIIDGDLKDLPMHEGDRVFTPWLEKQGYFVATFFYDDERVRKLEASFYHDEKRFLEHARETFGDLI